MLCSLTPPACLISLSLRHNRHDDTHASHSVSLLYLSLSVSSCLLPHHSFTLSIYADILCPFTPLQLTSLFHSIVWPQRPVAVATPPSGDGYLPCCHSNRFPVGFQMSHLSLALSFIFEHSLSPSHMLFPFYEWRKMSLFCPILHTVWVLVVSWAST